jgi:hypothetical protein
VSRPTLEGFVRRRLVQLPNIRVRERRDVVEPVFDRLSGRVTGVRVQSKNGSDDKEAIEADLVVDTSGRGSLSPTWLNAFGFAKPPEQQITVNLGYVTRFYRLKPEHMGNYLLAGSSFLWERVCLIFASVPFCHRRANVGL